MGRIVYLNGAYIPESEAKVSIFDRGFLMADAIYEVTAVFGGKLIDFDGHAARLERSLSELNIPKPKEYDNLLQIYREIIHRNDFVDGMIYLQITRGNPGDRSFAFPTPQTEPTIVIFHQSRIDWLNNGVDKTGIKIITVDDLRWQRCDIKTTQLLYASLCKQQALLAGCNDAWMVRDGFVTEGTSNNAFIVRGGKIITRPLSSAILSGITRAAVIRCAAEAKLTLEERAFTVEEAKAADEAFITSAMTFADPVVEIDGVRIGNGSPGPIAGLMRKLYLTEALKRAI